MLAFDGVSVMATVSSNSFSDRHQIPTSEQLQLEIRKFAKKNVFPGITGSISFPSDGDADQKVVLVLYFDKRGYTQIKVNPMPCSRVSARPHHPLWPAFPAVFSEHAGSFSEMIRFTSLCKRITLLAVAESSSVQTAWIADRSETTR
jgi:hypothetical protein